MAPAKKKSTSGVSTRKRPARKGASTKTRPTSRGKRLIVNEDQLREIYKSFFAVQELKQGNANRVRLFEAARESNAALTKELNTFLGSDLDPIQELTEDQYRCFRAILGVDSSYVIQDGKNVGTDYSNLNPWELGSTVW